MNLRQSLYGSENILESPMWGSNAEVACREGSKVSHVTLYV